MSPVWQSLGERAAVLSKLAKSAALKDFIKAASLILREDVLMPGPTGELNRLSLEPRGHFICVKDKGGMDTHISYICAALLANNFVTLTGLDAAPIARSMRDAGIPAAAFAVSEASIDSLIQTRDMSAVTLCAEPQRAREISRALAERDGEIVQLIWNSRVTPDLIHRFTTEKTVTINTAAIGGNAALLGISEHS